MKLKSKTFSQSLLLIPVTILLAGCGTVLTAPRRLLIDSLDRILAETLVHTLDSV